MYALVPPLVAAVLVAIGLSYLSQARRWLQLVRSWAERPERLFPLALGMLAAGIVIGYGYDSWHGTWPIFVTVLGWLMALEAAILLIAPGLLTRLVGALSDRFLLIYIRVGGVVVIVLGTLLGHRYVL